MTGNDLKDLSQVLNTMSHDTVLRLLLWTLLPGYLTPNFTGSSSKTGEDTTLSSSSASYQATVTAGTLPGKTPFTYNIITIADDFFCFQIVSNSASIFYMNIYILIVH